MYYIRGERGCQSETGENIVALQFPLAVLDGIVHRVPVLIEFQKLRPEIVHGLVGDGEFKGVEGDVEIVHAVHYIRGGVECQASNAENQDAKGCHKADRAEEVTDDSNRRGVFHGCIIHAHARGVKSTEGKTFNPKPSSDKGLGVEGAAAPLGGNP